MFPAAECIFVKTEEGTYTYTSPGGTNDVCGLYVIADPGQFVEFEFETFDVDMSCAERGMVSVVDGWELNGQFFPSARDHPISRNQRYREYCDVKPDRVFKMSQNVGMVEFRIPVRIVCIAANTVWRRNHSIQIASCALFRSPAKASKFAFASLLIINVSNRLCTSAPAVHNFNAIARAEMRRV